MFYFILICIIWVISAIVTFFMALLTRVLAPLLALVTLSCKDFPFFLAWFGQYDDNLDGDNDPGWQNEHMLKPNTGIRKWWNRTRWIFRNPSQYFDYWMMGQVVKHIVKIKTFGDPKVSDSPFKPGWCLRVLIAQDRVIPFLRFVWQWPYINKCLDVKLGYAVWDSVVANEKVKLVFSIDPFSKVVK